MCWLQYVDEERLEAIKVNVGLLKKLLRQKAVAELKLYRKEMEVRKGVHTACCVVRSWRRLEANWLHKKEVLLFTHGSLLT